jgi:hypothetical protein
MDGTSGCLPVCDFSQFILCQVTVRYRLWFQLNELCFAGRVFIPTGDFSYLIFIELQPESHFFLCTIGIGRSLTAYILLHHQAYGSPPAVRLIPGSCPAPSSLNIGLPVGGETGKDSDSPASLNPNWLCTGLQTKLG